MDNSTTIGIDNLRKQARQHAAAGTLSPGMIASLVDDAVAVGVLPRQAKKIIQTAKRAAVKAANERLAAGPLLEPDDDGLAEAVKLAGWAVRWNTIAGRVEALPPGGDTWAPAEGSILDDLLHACSKVARVQRGWRIEPFHIPSARLEKRVLGVVARRQPVTGEPDTVQAAVLAWAAGRAGERRSLGEVLKAAGCLNRYESSARAPRHVEVAARSALVALGWTYRAARRGGKAPAMLWVAPTLPTSLPTSLHTRKVVNLKPSSYT